MKTLKNILLIILFLLMAVALIYLSEEQNVNDTQAISSSTVIESKKNQDLRDSTNRRPSVINTELVKNIEEKVSKGLTVIPVVGVPEAIVVDESGKTIHKWKFDAIRARLLSDCNIMAIHGTSGFGKNHKPWSDMNNLLVEYDFNGKEVWRYRSSNVVHHDMHRYENGNTLFMEQHQIKLIDKTDLSKARKNHLRYDVIVEIDKDKNRVWEWHSKDYFDLASCGWRQCTNELEENQFRKDLNDWTHANTITVIPENKWYDAGDKRFKPGNILFMPRNFWTIMLIDKDSKEVVWKYDGRKEDSENPLIRGHDPYMIPEGFPGAGNIMVFDNGLRKIRPYSIIREINPSTDKLEWKYEDKENFFSRSAGLGQRLKNGNTLISQDRVGRIFEVTKEGEVVWELYVDGLETSRAWKYPRGYCSKLG